MAVILTLGDREVGRFETLTHALDGLAARQGGPALIRLEAGTYREKVEIAQYPWSITIRGEGSDRTRIAYGDFARQVGDDGKELGTFRTPTLTVRSDGVRLEDLTVANTAGFGPEIGQAVAAAVYGTYFQARKVGFEGHQDTLYTGGGGPQFYDQCSVEGTVDFIFGPAQAVFFRSEIPSVGKGYVTAASTPKDVPWGYLFYRCRLRGDPSTPTFLGRPWRPYASVTFVATIMDEHVRSEGWDNWRNPDNEQTARFAEYQSSGSGARLAERVGWAVASGGLPDDSSPLTDVLKALDGGTYGKDWPTHGR